MGVQVGESNTQIIYNYARLTRADGVAAPPLASVSGVTGSPYRGLSAFEERDAPFYFGREAAATQVLEGMSRHLNGLGLLVVSGVSGAGKSSLLRAGVLPRVRGAGLAAAPGSESWPCLLFTPARAPLDELAVQIASLAGADAATVRRGLEADPAGFALIARQAALAQPAGVAREAGAPAARLLLVVDQFEQLFTQCPDESQRRAFITALHTAATARYGADQAAAALVVLGVRADFEARCADYPQLADAIQDRYLVTPMTERQLRMAITEPAKMVGSSVDDDLVDTLLLEMTARRTAAFPADPGTVSSAGVLPLLSHALDQAWRIRTGAVLTLADYERTGGIEGAVAKNAQRAYDHLTPDQQAAARQVFMRLTAAGGDGIDTAQRVTRAELTGGKSEAEAGDVEAVLGAFAAERLLTLAADTVEITHDALLSAWPRLHGWLNADRDALRTHRRLAEAARAWESEGRDPGALYRGVRLADIREWASDPAHRADLDTREEAFLHASAELADREATEARRRTRRLRRLVAALASLLAAVTVAAGVAVHEKRAAVQQSEVANSRQIAGDAAALENAGFSTLAMQISVAAFEVAPTTEARSTLLSESASPVGTRLLGYSGPVNSLAFNPAGTTLAVATNNDKIVLITIGQFTIASTLTDHTDAVTAVAFSPDGRLLASGSDDRTARLWNVSDPAHPVRLAVLTGHTDAVTSVAFSRDGRLLATGSADHTVRLWDVSNPRHPVTIATLTGHTRPVRTVAFSPDAPVLATGGDDHTALLWDVSRPRNPVITARLTDHDAPVYAVAFSPDGRTLATGSYDDTIRLWNVTDPRRPHDTAVLAGHTGAVWSVAFSPDGRQLASGSGDDTTRLWDVSNRGKPRALSTMTGDTDAVNAVTFSPNGKVVVTGSADTTLRLWIIVNPRRPVGAADQQSASSIVYAVAASPTSSLVAAGYADGTTRIWDTSDPYHLNAVTQLTGPTNAVRGLAFSPNGRWLAAASDDHTVILWNLTDPHAPGKPITLRAHSDAVNGVAFSPDGRTLASASDDHTVILWNVSEAGHPVRLATLTGHSQSVNSVAFSPDGRTLASASDDHTVILWNVSDLSHPRKLATLSGHSDTVDSVAISPDGHTLATGSEDATTRLWDITNPERPVSLAVLQGNSSAIMSVAFSPGRHTLATGSLDDTAWLWDTSDPRHPVHTATLTGNQNAVRAVTFTRTGNMLITGSDDYTVRLWDTDPVTAKKDICSLIVTPITASDWAKYVPGIPYRNPCS
jgi:WD40 repeat protein